MQTFNDLFEAKLKALCAEEIEREVDILALGMAVTDIADYKYRTGIIAGLRKAVELCDEANRVLAER